MKNFLEIIIQPGGITVCHPQEGGVDENINANDPSFEERLARFSANNAITTTSVTIYLSEELLFFKTFDLPLKTPNLKDAVKFQLGLLTPFTGESILYSYSSAREKSSYKINLYAAHNQSVQPILQKITSAGYKVSGLFPESQRYVTRSLRKETWGLLLPGRFSKALVFNGTQMENRFLCSSDPEFHDLSTICDTNIIYNPLPADGSGYLEAQQLLAKEPLLKDFDLLPPAFKRPDYSKTIVTILLVLNAVALLALGGIKELRLNSIDQQVSSQINSIMPFVKEMNQLREDDQALAKNIEKLESSGTNPDLIDFLTRLTEALPITSYLDQLRLEKGGNAIHLQGFTENIGELTSKLQDLGETKLKSTSRRRNETFFQLEVVLQ